MILSNDHISNPISLEHVFFCEGRDRAIDKHGCEIMLHTKAVDITYLILYSAMLFCLIQSFHLFIFIIIYAIGQVLNNIAVENYI